MSYSPITSLLKSFQMAQGFKLPLVSSKVRSIAKKAQYGGRCEVYFMGDTRTWKERHTLAYFDHASQYGHIMAENSFPDYSNFEETKKPNCRNYLAYCTVRVRDRNGIAPLPLHHAYAGMIFPVGVWSGWYTNVDLDYKEIEVLEFKKTINFPVESFFFRGFINKFIPTGKDADPIEKAIKKNLYVGLAGKFSQSNDQTSLVRWDKVKLDDYRTGVFFGDWVLVNRKTRYPKSSNYVWTDYINAYGRQSQWRLFEKIWGTKGQVLYGDTDSAFGCWPGANGTQCRRIQNYYAGRVNGKPLAWAKLISTKCYLYSDQNGSIEVAARGIPSKLKTEIAEGEEELFAEIPDSFFQVLKYGIINKEIRNVWRKRKFSIHRKTYAGRAFTKDGWTRPLEIGKDVKL